MIENSVKCDDSVFSVVEMGNTMELGVQYSDIYCISIRIEFSLFGGLYTGLFVCFAECKVGK